MVGHAPNVNAAKRVFFVETVREFFHVIIDVADVLDYGTTQAQ
jgi:hypothetical protein